MEERERVRRWITGWNEASKRIQELKREEFQHVDIAQVIEDLNDAFESALLHMEPRTTSGLVEQQRWFMKALGRNEVSPPDKAHEPDKR